VTWVAIFAVFMVCHMVGDYLLQTGWQQPTSAAA
jgi:hypothetical protein